MRPRDSSGLAIVEGQPEGSWSGCQAKPEGRRSRFQEKPESRRSGLPRRHSSCRQGSQIHKRSERHSFSLLSGSIPCGVWWRKRCHPVSRARRPSPQAQPASALASHEIPPLSGTAHSHEDAGAPKLTSKVRHPEQVPSVCMACCRTIHLSFAINHTGNYSYS